MTCELPMTARLDGKPRADLGKSRKYATEEERQQKRREQRLAIGRRYRARNLEALRQRSAEYRAKNAEVCIARTRAWQAEFPDKATDSAYRRKYGISLAEVREKSEAQNNSCAICGEHRKLVVDHCHQRNMFRGLLCDRCNVALGCFEDDPVRLRQAAAYVEGFESGNT